MLRLRMSGPLPYSLYAFMACCSINGRDSFSLLFPVFLVRVRFEVDLSDPWLSRRHPGRHLCGLRFTHGNFNGISVYQKGIMIYFRSCITILSFSFRVTVLCVRPFNGTLTIRIIFKELLTNVLQLRDHPASAGSLPVFVGNSEFQEHTSNNQNIGFFDSMYMFF
jgi:hypothetical protein